MKIKIKIKEEESLPGVKSNPGKEESLMAKESFGNEKSSTNYLKFCFHFSRATTFLFFSRDTKCDAVTVKCAE